MLNTYPRAKLKGRAYVKEHLEKNLIPLFLLRTKIHERKRFLTFESSFICFNTRVWVLVVDFGSKKYRNVGLPWWRSG